MAVIRANSMKKLTIQVNEGTSSSPSLKNRNIGTGYWINPDDSTATDAMLYQLGSYFAALQLHELNAIKFELKSQLLDD